MSFSQMLRKSRSTFSLDRRQSDTAEAEPRRQPQPPLPSPRKIFTAASSPASEAAPPPLPAKTPTDVSRRLFSEDTTGPSSSCAPRVSPEFSSKTLRPKKKSFPADSEGRGGGAGGSFRPRNKSETVKHPEAVYNELAAILQRRRLHLETRPSAPSAPTVPRDDLPPYSKVNKAAKLQKVTAVTEPSVTEPSVTSPGVTSPRHAPPAVKPVPSFLHSFVQSAQYRHTQAQAGTSCAQVKTPSKGW